MHEVLVDRRQVVAMHHRVHQVFAHGDQRPRPAGREIEPAEQLLAARLGGEMQFGGGFVGTLARPGIDRRVDALAVDPETGRQRLEEGDARAGGQFVVDAENLARERDAGGFAPAGQQFVAQIDKAGRPCRSVTAPVAGTVHQGAAALRNGLQHLAKERGVHASRRSPDAARFPMPKRLARPDFNPIVAGPMFPIGRRTRYQV